MIQVSLDFAEVAEEYLRVTAPDVSENDRNRPVGSEWAFSWDKARRDGGMGQYGANTRQTREWLTNGYHVPEMSVAGEFALKSTRRRRVWDDFDGEPELDRLLQGDEFPFRTVRKVKESRVGITLNLDVTFNFHVSADIVAAYVKWLLELIAGLQAHGHDVEINITNTSKGMFFTAGPDEKVSIHTRVKRFGELSDFTSWSVMFSPSGFRQLGFTAMYVAAKKVEHKCAAGLGTAIPGDWGVSYDPQESVIDVKADGNASEFPRERLNAMLAGYGISAG